MGEALAEARPPSPAANGRTPPSRSSTRRWSRAAATGSARRRPDGPRGHGRAARGGPRGRARPAARRDDLLRAGALPDVRRRAPRGDVEALVYAVPNRADGAAGTVLQLASTRRSAPGRVVSGIRRDEVEELYAAAAARCRAAQSAAVAGRSASLGILRGGEVSEWLMVPLSKSGLRKQRGFESHPLRHPTADADAGVAAPHPRSRTRRRSVRCSASPSARRPSGRVGPPSRGSTPAPTLRTIRRGGHPVAGEVA